MPDSSPPAEPALVPRFRAALSACGVTEGDALLVAVSGGRDSVVLLHLLRFHAPALALTVAHFDHAIRAGSRGDARWLRGLCAAWNLPLVSARADRPLRGETAARDARLAFLRDAAGETGARFVVTAHHADDQAETVLFRALRGTGPAGLAGMRATGPGIVRPLLGFWRAELRRYARVAGLRWRTDPSNRELAHARNAIRHRLLPEAERRVAPVARRSLVRLAELARADEAAWEEALTLLAHEAIRDERGELLFHREHFRRLGEPLAARLLRWGLARLGIALDRSGTRAALQFIIRAAVGKRHPLRGGAWLEAEWEWVRAHLSDPPTEDLPVRVREGETSGEAELRLGGRTRRVQWGTGAAPVGDSHQWRSALRLDRLRFPLEIRARRPGDRMRTPGGSRSLKKLLLEERIPRSHRGTIPVVVDADGAVVWVAGLAVAHEVPAESGEPALLLRISDA
ncbi:tRNA lysidine(34) synthetase TilS [soil metagenome]